MNTSLTRLFFSGRGACPQAPALPARAVEGNGPCLSHVSAATVPPKCNLLGYTFSRLLLAVVTVGFFSVAISARAGSCCQPEPKPEPKDACCAAKEADAAPFTRTSLYQADGVFTDDSGKSFRLSALRGRPVVVNLFFATCGYACPLAVTDLLAVQARLSPTQRKDTVFVLVSFDLARDTVEALAKYRAARQLDGNWILLRGDDASVRELAALLGVKYKQEADGSFAHSNLFTILNREGEVVHQRIGLQSGIDGAVAALTAL